jgi:hypothetical protein
MLRRRGRSGPEHLQRIARQLRTSTPSVGAVRWRRPTDREPSPLFRSPLARHAHSSHAWNGDDQRSGNGEPPRGGCGSPPAPLGAKPRVLRADTSAFRVACSHDRSDPSGTAETVARVKLAPSGQLEPTLAPREFPLASADSRPVRRYVSRPQPGDPPTRSPRGRGTRGLDSCRGPAWRFCSWQSPRPEPGSAQADRNATEEGAGARSILANADRAAGESGEGALPRSRHLLRLGCSDVTTPRRDCFPAGASAERASALATSRCRGLSRVPGATRGIAIRA